VLIDHHGFRDCYEELMDGEPPADIMPAWVDAARDTFVELAPLRRREGTQRPARPSAWSARIAAAV
jgi:hypothetical protein